jgi:Zn-finger nucleic acid-binding protein
MPETRIEQNAGRPELISTLWHCPKCASLITIYSAEIIEIAICPICCDVSLDSRGNFETILGMPFQERSPAAS